MSEENKDQDVIVREYDKMDIFWYNSKPEIEFSNDTSNIRFCFKNKYLINMFKNIMMRALLITDELAKNADPKMLTSHIELNDFHPKRTNECTIALTIRPDWDKTLYDINIMYNGLDEWAPEGCKSKETKTTYKNENLTQNDMLAILHNLLPKASRHVVCKKTKTNNPNYLVSISQKKK